MGLFGPSREQIERDIMMREVARCAQEFFQTATLAIQAFSQQQGVDTQRNPWVDAGAGVIKSLVEGRRNGKAEEEEEE